jgi:hypothetical protein
VVDPAGICNHRSLAGGLIGVEAFEPAFNPNDIEAPLQAWMIKQ